MRFSIWTSRYFFHVRNIDQSKTGCFVDAAIARAKGQSILVCGSSPTPRLANSISKNSGAQKNRAVDHQMQSIMRRRRSDAQHGGTERRKREAAFGLKRPVKVAAFIHKINGSCEKFVTKGGMSCVPRVVTAEGGRNHGPIARAKYLNGTTLRYRSDEKQACFARIHLGKSTSAGQGLCGRLRVRERVSEIDVELDRQARRRVQPHPHYFPRPKATDRRRGARPGPPARQ